MKNSNLSTKQKKIATIKHHLQDVFSIYLTTDIAGDNEDRRKKLDAFTEAIRIIESS